MTDTNADVWDVVIVGAGPSGLAAAAAVKRYTSSYLLIELGKPASLRDR